MEATLVPQCHAWLLSSSLGVAKERSEKEGTFQNEYDAAAKLYENNPSALNENRLNEAKESLELFYDGKIKGIITCARARWHEHGERSTQYFFKFRKA